MPAKVKCPDCSATYETAKGLSSHRRAAHGYVSEREATRKERIRQAEKRGLPSPSPLEIIMPVDEPKQHGGRHAHEIHKGIFPCPHCDFVGKWKGGLTNHMHRQHGKTKERAIAKASSSEVITSTPNGHIHVPAAQAQDDHRLEAAATYAAGRVAQLLESIALQLDVSFRAFAPLVLRTVGETTTVR